ncbi:hypothetical protein BJX68DRAFT_97336 [Aspergillus pseudodeflectus]|uniref:Uncharacterized protein n=1 Tax=Aspergillus pseudodeflectus TaxID=176178 RepID=A0ABR4KAL5_9EURO
MGKTALKPDGTFPTSHRIALDFLDGKMSKTEPPHELLREFLRLAPEQHTRRPWDNLLVPLANFIIGCYTSNKAVFEEATTRETFMTSGEVEELIQRAFLDVREDPGSNARLTRRQTIGSRKQYQDSLCAYTHVLVVVVHSRQLWKRMTRQKSWHQKS